MTARRNPVFVALDTPTAPEALAMAAHLRGLVGGLKLGLEFFCAAGPDGVRQVMAGTDLPLFLDLKLYDIPNTVAGAVRSVAALAPAFLTLHASGGRDMMRAAADAAADEAARLGLARPRLLGVSVLTSMAAQDLAEVGVGGEVAAQVRRLAVLARDSGLDGVVCSPNECAILRAELGPDVDLMVPGIRPAWAAANDQKRILTPAQAIEAGASHLVIGRPITQAADPADAARRIMAELGL